MKFVPNALRATAAAAFCTLVVACSLFKQRNKEAPPPPPPPPAPVEAAPTETQRFELAPDQDVVGVVQLTTTTKEDTLTDIARRVTTRSEELLRANPNVDPWLPGADKQIVVPTEFILPNAPHQGVVVDIAAMRLFYFPKPKKKGEPQTVITHP